MSLSNILGASYKLLSDVSPYTTDTANNINFGNSIQKSYCFHVVFNSIPLVADSGLSTLTGITSRIDSIKKGLQLAANVKSIDLPEKIIQTTDVMFFGRKKTIPMSCTYENNQFTVIYEERESQVVYSTFQRWIDAICNSVSRRGSSDNGSKAKNIISNILSGNFQEWSAGMDQSQIDEWTTDLMVIMEDSTGTPINIIKINQVYPINIKQSTTLDYGTSTSILYSVQFCFSEYTSVTKEDIL